MNHSFLIKSTALAMALYPIAVCAEQSADVEQQKVDTQRRMAQAEQRIITRLGVTPRLTVEDQEGEDSIAKLAKSGAIIDCTLEEVEAALAAAAATSDTEDDIKAMRMLHWGSYRFFLDNEKVK